jgi:hypothetical protein
MEPEVSNIPDDFFAKSFKAYVKSRVSTVASSDTYTIPCDTVSAQSLSGTVYCFDPITPHLNGFDIQKFESFPGMLVINLYNCSSEAYVKELFKQINAFAKEMLSLPDIQEIYIRRFHDIDFLHGAPGWFLHTHSRTRVPKFTFNHMRFGKVEFDISVLHIDTIGGIFFNSNVKYMYDSLEDSEKTFEHLLASIKLKYHPRLSKGTLEYHFTPESKVYLKDFGDGAPHVFCNPEYRIHDLKQTISSVDYKFNDYQLIVTAYAKETGTKKRKRDH